MKSERHGINPEASPSGEGCVECLGADGWWLDLRRCTEMRTRGLLRQFAQSTRLEALSCDRASDRGEFRTRRNLVLRLSDGQDDPWRETRGAAVAP